MKKLIVFGYSLLVYLYWNNNSFSGFYAIKIISAWINGEVLTLFVGIEQDNRSEKGKIPTADEDNWSD